MDKIQTIEIHFAKPIEISSELRQKFIDLAREAAEQSSEFKQAGYHDTARISMR